MCALPVDFSIASAVMTLLHAEFGNHRGRTRPPRRIAAHAAVSTVAAEEQLAVAPPAPRSPPELPRGVEVRLAKPSFSSRKLDAAVHIAAPLDVVWGVLTDYDGLGNFIPGLVENRCLERREGGCLLYQVGAQDVALGVRFSATCTLDIQEHPGGIPAHLASPDGGWDECFPCPSVTGDAGTSAESSSMSSSDSSDEQRQQQQQKSAGQQDCWDISFALVEGDFQVPGLSLFCAARRFPPACACHRTCAVTPDAQYHCMCIEDPAYDIH
jgi:Polyketide cyclase / dehydrase and lipid transport